jgi:hypothetical protein
MTRAHDWNWTWRTALLLWGLLAPPAFAQDGDGPGDPLPGDPTSTTGDEDLEQVAIATYDDGRAAYDAGRFDEALALFQASYEMSRNPAVLWFVSLALEKLGRATEAIESLEQYLPEAADKKVVVQRIIELSDAEGTRALNEGDTADALVLFERAWELSQLPRYLERIATAHERLMAYEAAIDRLVAYREFTSGEQRTETNQRITRMCEHLRITSENLPETCAAPPKISPVRRTVGWALTGGGGALLVTGAALAGAGWAGYVGDGQTNEDKWRPMHNAGWGLLAVGGAVTITGVVLALVPPKQGKVAVLPSAGGFSLAGRF